MLLSDLQRGVTYAFAHEVDDLRMHGRFTALDNERDGLITENWLSSEECFGEFIAGTSYPTEGAGCPQPDPQPAGRHSNR